jgi:hypothetical protein
MVAYVEWAEARYQDVVLPWSILAGVDDAIRFAEDLKTADNGYGGYTSISAAIEFSARLLAKTPLNPARRVIDISGDGRNNDGPSLTEARSRAVAEGITINGLPLLLPVPPSRPSAMLSGAFEQQQRSGDLEDYYSSCVMGGPGAFVVAVRSGDQFAQALLTKLVVEISGLLDRSLALEPASSRGRHDCDG